MVNDNKSNILAAVAGVVVGAGAAIAAWGIVRLVRISSGEQQSE